ncbi:hypothetical protein [Jiangella endophytica]|uniref:hypothetical protein n=1 Tax=Jiangella endophytica TaxID=1623398 RepID=UPI0013005C23|nr:hypothetical protein [Jiangella endophytica]
MASQKPDSRFYQGLAGMFLLFAVIFAISGADGADVVPWIFIGAAGLAVVFGLRAKK